MSWEVVGDKESLGQFASNAGFADLVEASQDYPALRRFFDRGETDDVVSVVAELRDVDSPSDVAATARELARLLRGQKTALVTNGVVADDEDVDKYDPDQPRDEQGRWTAGGSSGEARELRGPAASRISPKEAAAHVLDHARKVEPEMTRALVAVVGSRGGEMQGLEFRLKSEESLERKIRDKAAERGITYEEQAARVGDALRYTATFPPDRYTEGTMETIRALKLAGFEVTDTENFWPPNQEYHGIHVNVRSSTGLNVELQFHTDESFRLKMEGGLHKYYEVYRDPRQSPRARYDAFQTMVRMSSNLRRPPNVLSICCPRSRAYNGPMPAELAA